MKKLQLALKGLFCSHFAECAGCSEISGSLQKFELIQHTPESHTFTGCFNHPPFLPFSLSFFFVLSKRAKLARTLSDEMKLLGKYYIAP